MIRLFGYDDASGRNWINLEFVARARYDKARHTVECVLANGGDKSGERITLQGDAAAALAKALALIEKDERKA